MKRYLLFTGGSHYPKGGWEDFHGSYDTTAEAWQAAANSELDWWHIVDTETMAIVSEGKRA